MTNPGKSCRTKDQEVRIENSDCVGGEDLHSSREGAPGMERVLLFSLMGDLVSIGADAEDDDIEEGGSFPSPVPGEGRNCRQMMSS